MLSSKNNEEILQSIVMPWYNSLNDSQRSQTEVLLDLLKGYNKTQYGVKYGASNIESIDDFKKNFPVINYKMLDPYLSEVAKGHYNAILSEPLVCWVMTRGSTGPAKVLPATKTHLEHIFSCGARALVNHVLKKKEFEILTGGILNLNFPSNVHTMTVNGRNLSYGYSSGTYARLNPVFDRVSLVPRQEEIDSLGSGITKSDWERRFELAYQRASQEGMVAAMGVTPIILSFAKYVEHKHGKKPKDIWKMHALFCTSVRKIQFKYAPILKRYFGQIPVIEMYSATEGVFAQQIDDLPYVTPNYDKYFFEVDTGKEVKPLYELKRGEYGKLIISSCMYPRYDIGDLIEAAGKNYFRIFGRNNFKTLLEHRIYRLLFGHFI